MAALDRNGLIPFNCFHSIPGRLRVSHGSSNQDRRTRPAAPSRLALTPDHRMLLEIRDTLYEGCWDDFARDLNARRRAEPHVFDTVPESPAMLATIEQHLVLIAEMQAWEQAHATILHPDGEAA
jgi:hypothetical protein